MTLNKVKCHISFTESRLDNPFFYGIYGILTNVAQNREPFIFSYVTTHKGGRNGRESAG